MSNETAGRHEESPHLQCGEDVKVGIPATHSRRKSELRNGAVSANSLTAQAWHVLRPAPPGQVCFAS
jgi:hypothetical protein